MTQIKKFSRIWLLVFIIVIFITITFILTVLPSCIQINNSKTQAIQRSTPGNLRTLSSPPIVLWNKTWGSPDTDIGTGVAVDANGSVYYVGSRSDYLTLIKFFSNGTMAWEYIHPTSSAGDGVAVDNDGCIYCTGTDNSATSSMLLVKFLSNGTIVWARNVPGGLGATAGFGVAVDNNGSIYCAGLKIIPFPLSTDSLLVKFFSNGTKAWECTFETGVPFWSVAVDSAGFVYSIGSNSGTPSSSLFKIHPISRSTVWQRSLPFVTSGITVDSNGSSYCVGYTEYFYSGTEDLCLTQFLSNGTKAWDTTWSTPETDQGGGVAVDAKGVIYCGGNTLGYGPTENLVLIAIFPNGTEAWQFIGNNSNANSVRGVALDAEGSIFYAGSIGTDFLLLKLGGTIPSAPQNLQAIAGNNQINLTWQAPLSDGASDITNYKIYRGTASGGETYYTTLGNVLTYTNINLTNGQPYYYKVSAVNGIGEGSLSNEVNATPIVDNTPPTTATITSPSTGANITGIITITANTADNIGGTGVKNVTFWDGLPGVGAFIGSDSTFPISYPWNTAGFDGYHSLYVRVFDFANNYLDSNASVVRVDSSPPITAMIIAPIIGANVSKTITIAATVADNAGGTGVRLVRFYCDGNTYLGEKRWAPYSLNWDTTSVGDGLHSLKIQVVDFTGNPLNSTTLNIRVDNTAPTTASISSPTAGAYLKSSIPITATATDAGSGVRNVTFYLDTIGGTVIGVDWTFPFAVQWNTTGFDGAHLLYIRAFDMAGNYLDSGGTLVTVDNMPPTTATITSPAAGAYVKGTTVITAIAVDNPGGSGAGNVTFYRDAAVLLGTDTTSPYTYSWNTATTSDGAHTFYVRVFDRAGNYLTSATVAIMVDNTAPTSATLTSPTAGATVQGTILINATAADAIGIKNLTFYRDAGVLIGTDTTSPYSVTWNTGTTSYGAHTLYVRVFDRAGNFLDSVSISVTVNNTASSSASVTAPAAGAYVKGTIGIGATASDPDGIKNVTFYRDAGVLIGTDPTSPYSVTWNTGTTSDGVHSLYVRAFDNLGNYLDSAPVAVTVDNTVPSAASITSPIAGSYLKGTVPITATGTDAIGIKNISFYRDAAVLIGTDTTSPYTQNWPTAGIDGPHNLYVRVSDYAGNYLDSAPVAVTVDNTPPSAASVTAPTVGAYLKGTITITGSGTDTIGIKNITFYRDTAILLGTDTTSPYSMSWNTTAVTDSTHNLYIRVFDNAGNYLDSAATAITVDNTPPTSAVITFPPDGAYLKGTILIYADGTDAIGVKNVTFWRDAPPGTGTMIGWNNTTIPCSINWNTTMISGSHILYVRVIDKAGNYLDSTATNVIVDNTPPTTAVIIAPSAGSWVKGTILITAIAADNPGGSGVGNVTFYRDAAVLLGTDTSAPYSINWNTVGFDCNHTLYVRLFDNAGNYLTSAPVAIYVDNTPPSGGIIFPLPGTYVKGIVIIRANFTDNKGIKNVTFYRDADVLIGSDNTPPYEVSWNTVGSDGAHNLYARVYDYANNYLDSATVAITVDNTAPSAATITSPTAGAYVNGTITITGTGVDAIGVKNLTFYRDAGILLATDTTAPYAVQWNTVGLDGAHTLYVRVYDYAMNYLDSASISVAVNNTSLVTVPTAPQNLQVTSGNGYITLMWQTPSSNGGSAIINYKIYRGTSQGSETYLTTVGNVLIYINTGLANGQPYYYKVSAVNGVGEGPLSNETNATPATVPTAPQNLQAIAGNRQVTLTWQAPASNGGSSVISYRIYRGMSPGNESLLATIGNILTFSDTNLTNGHRYHYKISAINGIGEGSLSLEVHAKPVTKPNAPQNLLIVVQNGKIFISWHSPSDDGGEAIISYKIYRGISSGNETYLITVNNTSNFTDANIVNGQTYYYRISAVNAMGESQWSAEVIAMVYISKNGNQTFYWILIIVIGAVALGISSYAIYFNRKMKGIELEIAKKSKGHPIKLGKRLSMEPFEVEEQISQLPMSEEEKQLIRRELHGLEDQERIDVFMNVSGNLSAEEAKKLWDSIMLRFNRLYKLENWAQALIVLEELFEIVDFLGDDSKFNDLVSKYDEIQEKHLKNISNNQIPEDEERSP